MNRHPQASAQSTMNHVWRVLLMIFHIFISKLPIANCQYSVFFTQLSEDMTHHVTRLIRSVPARSKKPIGRLRSDIVCPHTDWFGEGTMNTSSMTPFRGAYMHFFISFPATPNATVGLDLLGQLAGMLEPHVNSVFPYANLATDPDSGDPLLASTTKQHSCPA